MGEGGAMILTGVNWSAGR